MTGLAQTSQFASCNFLKGRWDKDSGAPTLSASAWLDFAATWNGMPRDGFMADGGLYRFRRFSEFKVDHTGDSILLLPHVPYRQSKQVNYLNGGLDRHYEPLLPQVEANAVFRQALLHTAQLVGRTAGASTFLVQVFQNRIVASGAMDGKPTPEGMHRDGVDFVLSLMAGRTRVDGGRSHIYTADGTPVDDFLMSEMGDFILLNDEAMKHSVTPIRPAPAADEGHRDVMIAMFTVWQHGLR